MLDPFIEIDPPQGDFITQLRQSTLCALPWMRLTEIRFALAHFDHSLFARYGIAPPAFLDKAVAKRRAEYLASRYAARIALSEFGIADFLLANDVDRAPRWPKGIVGSLTHTAERAVIITAPADSDYQVGVDAEKLIDPAKALELCAMIVCGSELEFLKQRGIPLALALTLAFSLKESLFKALYPVLRQFIDFHAAELIDVDITAGRATLALRHSLGEKFPAGRLFSGYFTQQQGEVLTVIAYRP